jgi:hypothetical protein
MGEADRPRNGMEQCGEVRAVVRDQQGLWEKERAWAQPGWGGAERLAEEGIRRGKGVPGGGDCMGQTGALKLSVVARGL